MATTKRRHSKEEFVRRGDAIYEKSVRPEVTADDEGKFAAIDIESGEFAIDADELKACRKLRKRIPDAQIWMVRIGFRHVHRFRRVAGSARMLARATSCTIGRHQRP